MQLFLQEKLRVSAIVDFHTHIGDVINGLDVDMVETGEKPFRLFEYLYEKFEFKSPLPGKQPSWMRLPLAIEIQKRHPWGTKERLVESLKRNGITHAVVLPIEPMTPTEKIYMEIREQKNLLLFASIDPRNPSRLERLKSLMNLPVHGLKLHPILQRTSPEDPTYFEIIEEFRTSNKPVIFHTGEFDYFVPRTKYSRFGDPLLFEKIIKSFPDVKFILAHSGLHTPEKAIHLAQKYKNVYIETSFQSARSLKNIFSQVDSGKILFGSDWPSSFQESHLKVMLKALRFSPELGERIFYKNAQEILMVEI